MILTVTLNASIDKTYTVEGFQVDHINRPSKCVSTPGSKGINVARVFKTLGRDAIATGFVGGSVGEAIISGLNQERIAHDFVRVREESRHCIKVMDPRTGTQTEINEPGPNVAIDELESLLTKIRSLVGGCEFVVLSGNCPPGVPPGFYGDIISIARSAGVRTVLDTSGEHFAESIKAGPWMVKPNVGELSQLCGQELYTLEEISGAAKSLKQYGVEVTGVTMGRSGAIATDGVQVWQATPPQIEFASAVGSGDAFVAAFLDAVLDAEPISEALVWGTAAGAANATSYGAGFCSKESIIEIRQGVTLTKLS